VFALGHAGAVSIKTDLYARKEGMKVLKALKKVGKAEEKRRGKNIRARRSIIFGMDQSKL